VNGFATAPDNPKVMYSAMRDGLFRSADAGQTWTPVGTGLLRDVAAVTVNPRRPSEVYAAMINGVIFRSTDGGATWERR
jgi:photosystem II stability/assembly factor-like uncharacterized protein